MNNSKISGRKVLFIGGNIIRFDATYKRVYNILSSFNLDSGIMIAMTSPMIYFSNKYNQYSIKKIFRDINVEIKILPRFPIFLLIYTITTILLKGIDNIHCFSFTPTLLGSVVKFFTRKKLITHLGGIIADERVSVGIWNQGDYRYKISKFLEKLSLEYCDHVLVVSQTFKDYLQERDKINSIIVIENCVNEKRFFFNIEKRDYMRNKYNLNDKLVVVFSGSFAPWDYPKEIINSFIEIKRKITNAHFLILTMSKDKISEMILERGIPKDDFTILSLPFDQVPAHLMMGDIALLFRSNSIVHRVGSPMKFAEYLACGLPIIGNDGLGELSKIVEDNKVGAIVDFDNEAQTGNVINEFLTLFLHDRESIRQRCIDIAVGQFSYKHYLNIYLKLYES